MAIKKIGRFISAIGKSQNRQHRSSQVWQTGKDLSEYEERADHKFFFQIGQNAATNAINENRAMRLPVTYMKDGWVVREMPEGNVKRVVEIQVKPGGAVRDRKLTKGTVIHVKKNH